VFSRKLPHLSPLLLLLSVSSCLEYHPKAVEKPDVQEWKTKAEVPQSNQYLSDKWWEAFQDPKLNQLMATAIKENPSIKLAVARLREANAFYTVTNADRYPQLDFHAYGDRRKLAEDIVLQSTIPIAGAGGGAGATTTSSTTTTTITPPTVPPTPQTTRTTTTSTAAAAQAAPTIKLHRNDIFVAPELRYEFDFWGKYAMSSKAAIEDIKSSEEALNTALLLLTTQVAETYCELRTFDTQITLVEALTKSWQDELTLRKSKKMAGITSEIDPETAALNLHITEVQLAELKKTRAIAENLLATLVGDPAPNFEFKPIDGQIAVPEIPVGLPSELLAKRPDVRDIEHQIEAARLNVGVQKTAYLPSISISGYYGYEGTKFRNIFKWRNHVWDTSANILTTIFDGWRIAGNIETAKAQYQEQIATYISTVLGAFQEVENALQSVQTADKTFVFRTLELENAECISELYAAQFQAGIIDYMTVLQAERTSLNAALDETNARLDRLSATVQLVKSIGGSWQQAREMS